MDEGRDFGLSELSFFSLIFTKLLGGHHIDKVLLSILGGVLIGGIICYLFMDYETSNYVIQNYYGLDEKEIKEWDFSYITQAGFIILITTLLIYFSWVVVEKRIDKNK
ncbi:hypothetical protein [Bacillus sp. B4EP4a]|uniref:hypothetical protein n=1 Tax=Bacillus sp. B4EP4a TaxID=2590665 RepID=UPI001153A7F7|nr:hypothetical protein [Bacillus sp. B4EP4a]